MHMATKYMDKHKPEIESISKYTLFVYIRNFNPMVRHKKERCKPFKQSRCAA